MAPTAINMSMSMPHLGSAAGGPTNEDCGIREVWAHNLDNEFKTICQMVRKFNYVAMDTEFPGVVARPIGEFKSTADYQYQLLRCNVDLLKIIQLGLTFFDNKGNLPQEPITTWQFNFKFNLTEDMYAEDSVDLLRNSGIQFEKHEQEGITPMAFAEMMLSSGLVLLPNVRWLSFHSGYDFGYLIKLLTDQNLPKSEGEFFELLKIYFPNVYDVKYLMKSCKNLKGGLQEVANELEVKRIGPQHQAGSDSLLTGQTFFRMKEMFFEDDIDDSKYLGHLYGLGTNFCVVSSSNNSNNNGGTTTTNTSTTTTASGSTAATSTTANGGTNVSSTANGNGNKNDENVSNASGAGTGEESVSGEDGGTSAASATPATAAASGNGNSDVTGSDSDVNAASSTAASQQALSDAANATSSSAASDTASAADSAAAEMNSMSDVVSSVIANGGGGDDASSSGF